MELIDFELESEIFEKFNKKELNTKHILKLIAKFICINYRSTSIVFDNFDAIPIVDGKKDL